jgi:hypothetical protein
MISEREHKYSKLTKQSHTFSLSLSLSLGLSPNNKSTDGFVSSYLSLSHEFFLIFIHHPRKKREVKAQFTVAESRWGVGMLFGRENMLNMNGGRER